MKFNGSLLGCVVLVAALVGCKKEAPDAEATEAAAAEGAAEAAATAAEAEKPAEGAPAADAGDIPAPDNVAAAPADAQKSESGLAWVVLTPGDGKDYPNSWDQVEVNYTGWTTDGKMFDSSVKRGQPIKLPLNRVIPGWTEGVQLMTKGEKRRFWIPGSLAYGEAPAEADPHRAGGPPLGTLVFDIELLDIIPGVKPPDAPADVAAIPKDAQTTKSGLGSKVLEKGKGKTHPAATDRVKVHYTGWTTDGKMFDSSVVRGQPVTFGLNQVIPGWTEGVQLMVEGEKRRLWIPEELAYKGQPGRPAGMLVFDVELIEIVK
jgi:peptidylprolyl isomerase